MSPDLKNMRIDFYADTDFAGLYTTEDKMDSVSVNSRTVVLLTFRNVPILWSSKIQSEIVLSTLEVEYIALSQGMRELVSAWRLLFELGNWTEYDLKDISHVSKAWEDNNGTENLSNSKGNIMTSRTKHISIKYHWFRSMIKPKEIEFLRIDTKDQRADIFTKDLTRFNFEQACTRVMGW